VSPVTFLRELHQQGSVSDYRLLRNCGDPAKSKMLPLQALIQFRDDAQFATTFAAQATRGIHSGEHGRIMAIVSEIQIEVFRQVVA
jgi:hypothetical protein